MIRGKRDANEREIIDALESVGASVAQLEDRAKAGLTDLVVGWADPLGRKHNLLVEVKMPGEKLRAPDQVRFHATWRGPIVVVESSLQALRYLGFDAKRIDREARRVAQAGR